MKTGHSLAAFRKRLAANRVAGQVGWVVSTFGINQVLRLGTNVVLAWLLSPVIFGVLTLVNTLRTGVELITDVGVGQNIVVAKAGDEPSFIGTAWTIQVIRGVGLFALGLLAAWPIAWWYDNPALFPIFAVASVIFLLTGINSPARFLMQRHRETRRLALFDLAMAFATAALSILFALLVPTVWGMIWSMIAYSVVATVAGFFMMDARILRLRIDPAHAATVFAFGKWIFISSLVYFVATNFDRLYLPGQLGLALFGVYGIARTISDAVTLLVQRLGAMIIFPAIAEVSEAIGSRLHRIARLRGLGLAALTVSIAGTVAIGDAFIAIAYDDRYSAAQVILPMLVAGTWFSAQAAMGEAILLGLSAPARAAAGNAAKLAWIVLLLPLAFTRFGLVAGIAVIAFADLPRYLMLQLGQMRAGLNFWRQDAVLLALGVAACVGVRLALVALGIVDGFVSSDQLAQLSVLSR